MRATDLELYSNDVQIASMSLRDSDPSLRYVVKSITGLDADDIGFKFKGFGSATQKRFYERTVKPRIISIRLSLNPRFDLDETFADLRDTLYGTIASSMTGLVQLRFLFGASALAQIEGHVTKFEVVYFSNQPEIQLTIECEDPLFRGMAPIEYTNAEFGATNPVVLVDQLSSAPHGFTLHFTVTVGFTSFVISDKQVSPEWTFTVSPTGGFSVGNTFFFSNEYNQRKLYIVKSGVTTHLMDKVNVSSVWPQIFRGVNEFYISNIGKFTVTKCSFYPAHWGV